MHRTAPAPARTHLAAVKRAPQPGQLAAPRAAHANCHCCGCNKCATSAALHQSDTWWHPPHWLHAQPPPRCVTSAEPRTIDHAALHAEWVTHACAAAADTGLLAATGPVEPYPGVQSACGGGQLYSACVWGPDGLHKHAAAVQLASAAADAHIKPQTHEMYTLS